MAASTNPVRDAARRSSAFVMPITKPTTALAVRRAEKFLLTEASRACSALTGRGHWRSWNPSNDVEDGCSPTSHIRVICILLCYLL
jgi:hypothetical protein